jgi:hypothetical protein
MNTIYELYKQVKPDVETISDALFSFSEQCLQKSGNFLPHAAVLTKEGKVELVATAPNSKHGFTNSTQELPALHEGLRKRATIKSIKAVGIAENVTITPDGQPTTQAIKVLIEHECGLTIALYLPFCKRFLRGYLFGEIFSVPAKPEVKIWSQDAA